MLATGMSIEFDNGEVLMVPSEFVNGDCSTDFCGKEEKIDMTNNDGSEFYRAEAIKISIDRDFKTNRDKSQDNLLAYFYREYGNSDKTHDELLRYLYDSESHRYIRSFQRILANEKEDIYHLCAWDGEDEHTNPYQQIKTNKHGDLFIVISEDMTLLDTAYLDDVINADDYEVFCIQSLGRLTAKYTKEG